VINRTKTLCFFILAVYYFANLQCGSPTEPPIIKNPREYTWTVDTLFYPGAYQTAMQSIWGSSSNNIYTVGHCETIKGQMWHFDGKQWIDLYTPFGISYNLLDITGFSANDIWAVGSQNFINPLPPPNFLDSAFIMHYNGYSWNYVKVDGGRRLETIWGSSSNDIWAAGPQGTLFHYNGTSWIKVEMDTSYDLFDMIGMNNNEAYLLSEKLAKEGDYTSIYNVIFKYDGDSWKQFDSSGTFNKICNIGGTLYGLGYGVYKYSAGSWQTELLTNDASLGGYFAVSGSNVILVGQNSLVYHYNGSDWKRLNLTNNQMWFFSAWATENEILIVGSDYSAFRTYVFHGK
jgi:hypothetical protein